MGLEEEYPRPRRKHYKELCALLAKDTDLASSERELLAMMIGSMADEARDLDNIFHRLLHEEHTTAEIGDLLIAFQLTNEQLRGSSDMIEKKLFDIGDRLKALATTNREKSNRRTVNHRTKPVNGRSRRK